MRIAIANDSVMIVEVLRRVLLASGQHVIAWTAADGAEAVAKALRDTPDVILMDVEMPIMDSVEATRRIMAARPCAILIVTATIEHRAAQVFQCLGAGALDVVKLSGHDADATAAESALIVKLQVLSHIIGKPLPPARETSTRGESAICTKLVAIGASAGGPPALATLLTALPSNFPAGIIIIQHLDPQFVSDFAEWLNGHSALPVRLAREGDHPEPGRVLLAAGDRHLCFTGPRQLGYATEPRDYTYRPSIDVFFESAARHWKAAIAGVLLTGMGRDGARGLKLLAASNALTIAQSAATSAVYGMPKAAADIGAAKEILDLKDIAPRLEAFFLARTPAGDA